MGVGGELNGAVYQAASELNPIPDTTAMAYGSRDSDLYRLIYHSILINDTFFVFNNDCARPFVFFFSFFFSNNLRL